MAYTRPPYNAYNVTWLGTSTYASPASTATDFNLSGYRLTIPISIATVEDYQLTVSTSIVVYAAVQPTLPIQISTYANYQVSVPISLATFELYALTVPLQIVVADLVHPVVPISISTFALYTLQIPLEVTNYIQLSIPLQVQTYENYSLSAPIQIAVVPAVYGGSGVINGGLINGGPINGSDGYEVYRYSIPLNITVALAFTIPIVISKASANWVLSVPIGIKTFEYHQASVPLEIEVTPPSFRLAVPLQLRIYETFSLSVSLKVAVIPAFASGTGGQGVGKVIDLPSGNYQRWSLRVTLGGTDVSSRLTGELSVDAEENAAKVAVFSLRPASGQVNPYAWVKAPVEIFYVINDSNGNYLTEVLLFKGIVDTPVYDTTSRLTEFTCTDDLQNVILSMTHGQVDALTPNAEYSRFVFDETVNSWDYLQDRLSTYPYAVSLNANRQPVAYTYKTGLISYEFQSNTVLDGSLSVTLANAREITNSVYVSLNTQMEVYRETAATIKWTDHNFGRFFPDWWMNTPERILSAISSTGANFVVDPVFQMTPESQTMREGIIRYNFMNYGQELLATAFIGCISKRFTQTLTLSNRVQIRDSLSISQLGELGSEVSGAVSVEYDPAIATAFEQTLDKTGWLCSASNGFQAPRSAPVSTAGDPKLFVSDGSLGGWVPYPLYQIQYTVWDNESTVLGNTDQYKQKLDSDSYLYSASGGFGEPGGGRSGEFLYNFESFILSGTSTERQQAYNCLVAQAKQTILASHRQNRVSFSTFINPMIERGMTLRVACDTLYATGVAHQINHNFDIDSGSALTNITLAVSSSKAIGLAGETEYRLSVRLLIAVTTGTTTSQIPMDEDSISYSPNLLTYYGGSSSEDYTFGPHTWGGFFTGPTGPGEFAIEFPALSEENTGNAQVTVDADAIEAGVPNDEFILIA